jgi:glucose-1-phosphate cytidylyltransferase
MQAVILCGGRGTRAYPHTLELPKPLMTVGEVPILRHVMEIYARQGIEEFVLSAGFRADLIEDFAAGLPAHWKVTVVDTGESTGTGGRVRGCAGLLEPSFFVTYGDGLAPVDLGALTAFHAGHGGCVTVTAVPLPSPYGTLEWNESGKALRFLEKPRLPDHWINGGFFVIDRRAFEQWHGDDLEREVLPALVGAGELYVFRHRGFWRSMDTYKDALELSALCEGADAPWTISPDSRSSSQEEQGSLDPTSSGDSSPPAPRSTR